MPLPVVVIVTNMSKVQTGDKIVSKAELAAGGQTDSEVPDKVAPNI